MKSYVIERLYYSKSNKLMKEFSEMLYNGVLVTPFSHIQLFVLPHVLV